MNIEDLVKNSLQIVINPESHKNFKDHCVGYSHFVREFKTLGLSVPRRSGKTEYLLQHNRRNSSLLFFMNLAMISNYRNINFRDGIYTFSEIETLKYKNIGKRMDGLKYDCFLIDEPCYMTARHLSEFWEYIDVCKARDLLTEDFYVLSLGTHIR